MIWWKMEEWVVYDLMEDGRMGSLWFDGRWKMEEWVVYDLMEDGRMGSLWFDGRWKNG